MIPRRLSNKIHTLLKHFPAVALLGPRQVGKTTLALEISKHQPSIYLDLENPVDLLKAHHLEDLVFNNPETLIILDEIHRMPEIFIPIRSVIDRLKRSGKKTGQFLFLGSASLTLLKQSSETLAGRLAFIELCPIDLTEFTNYLNEDHKINQLWTRGGFPDSLLAEDDTASLLWRQQFIKTYLERDIPQLGPRIPATTLERLWTMLAHHQGQSLNVSKLAVNLDVSNVTVSRYIDLFTDLLLIRKIQPYTSNVKKRLVKASRVYIRDSGICHALLNIRNFNDLLGDPVIGKSWEGFVIENIIQFLPPNAFSYYYRTPGGAEIDLVLELHKNEKWAIEIKRKSQLSANRGYYEACETIHPSKKYIVHSGSEHFQTNNGIELIPLIELLNNIRKLT
ncbi:MAG: ATP-binding protein [Saprospiraceae bacterium]|nr:ATP-binding protein [Saprospiraceae bacterium]